MTILAFYPVENELGWERHEFDCLDDDICFKKMWVNRNEIEVRFFNMDTKKYSDPRVQDGLLNADEFEEDYNNEDFDGGWWVKALIVDELFVNDVILKNREA